MVRDLDDAKAGARRTRDELHLDLEARCVSADHPERVLAERHEAVAEIGMPGSVEEVRNEEQPGVAPHAQPGDVVAFPATDDANLEPFATS